MWNAEFADLEDAAGPVLAAGGRVIAERFPLPNTEGMSPEQRDAAVADWRAAVAEWIRRSNSPSSRVPAAPPAGHPGAHKVPTS